ncbi:beta-lactamase-like protein [Cadophora sp. MPI-SDFR-AT-0126]|nr:beta-lactamase-like protein [Leotiomycetes sp. MPI-SDFR-AT-0126]
MDGTGRSRILNPDEPLPIQGPDGRPIGTWSPISCTLIHGSDSAILVDTPITTLHTNSLADWIASTIPHKKLTAIYVTHGHGDHFFGLPTLRKRFPGVKTYATQGTLDHMLDQLDPSYFHRMYGSRFPRQIDQQPPLTEMVEVLPPSGELELESHTLIAIEVGQADTHNSTVLWVPCIRLAVCGDVVYGDCHQMLAECTTSDLRTAWIRSIRKVESLSPDTVVPGHKKEGEVDGTWHLKETREYIQTFDGLIRSGKAKNSKELTSLMLQKYPHRFNPGALIMGSMAAFRSTSKI